MLGIMSSIMLFVSTAVISAKEMEQGLIGGWYGEADLTRCIDAVRIKTLEQVWDKESGHGKTWSAKWEGFLVAPANGEITFHAETDKSVTLETDRKKIIQLKDGETKQSGSISLVKGEKYPITVTYSHDGAYDGYFRIKWSWAGGDKVSIPVKNLLHTIEQANHWGWEPADISNLPPIDRSEFVTVPVKNVIVYYESGRFTGWPANNGIWCWDDEILVGLHAGYYEASEDSHSIDRDRPSQKFLARSLDGGETWTIEKAEFDDDEDEAQPWPGKINFGNPDFAMRCDGSVFWISYDRGRTWNGSYMTGSSLDIAEKDIKNTRHDAHYCTRIIRVTVKKPLVE